MQTRLKTLDTVRATMLDLPFQWFWDHLTGSPALDPDQPLAPSRWEWFVARGVAFYLLALAANIAVVAAGLWLLFPLTLVLALGGARHLQLNVAHWGVHRAYGESAETNHGVMSLVLTIAVSHSVEDYRLSHLKHHRPDAFAGPQDDDPTYLCTMGISFDRGVDVAQRQLLYVVTSPAWHLHAMSERVRNQWMRNRGLERVARCFWLGALASTFLLGPHVFLLGVVAVLGPGVSVAMASQYFTEHDWPRRYREKGPVRARDQFHYSQARFCGEPAPVGVRGWRRIPAWAIWLARMLTVHALLRTAVVPGDVLAHDEHHRGNSTVPGAPWQMTQRRAMAVLRGERLARHDSWGWGQWSRFYVRHEPNLKPQVVPSQVS